MKSIIRRLEIVEREAKAGHGFLIMEDILRIIYLERQKVRTPMEEQLLAKLKSMAVDPKLDKVLSQIEANREKSAGNIGPEISS